MSRQVWFEGDMNRAIRRMAIEIVEKVGSLENLMVVGIQTRGVQIGQALAKKIEEIEGQPILFGMLDTTLYRDDQRKWPPPLPKENKLLSKVAGKVIVLVDDVIHTGRTARAALAALFDNGRPEAVMIAALVQRVAQSGTSGRKFQDVPIHAEVVGKSIPTGPGEHIKVRCREVDGIDEVVVIDDTPG